MRVLCVTPNVAIDRTLEVPGFHGGGVWRARAVRAACGGKGINVARALVSLGQKVICSGVLAGRLGQLAADLAKADGLDGRWTWVKGETRTCVIIVGTHGATTVINEPGVRLGEEEWRGFVDDVGRLARDADSTCICGSFPPGRPEGGVAALVGAASQGGRKPVWVDTSGAALEEAITARPFGIKINTEEAAAVTGAPVETATAALAAARGLRRRGIAQVAITLGGQGAVIATGQGDWLAQPPRVVILSAVGSGDCFLAGLVAGLAERVTVAEALRLATACGTANAIRNDVGVLRGPDLTRLMANTEVQLLTG